ncbi:MAG TPA: hypothetical protein VD995_30995 [Azospirillum sp.]|nr:hypothetical protein [Azospirillum sp.]
MATDHNQRLGRVLELPGGWRPFFWQAGPAGVFVFSHQDADGPTRLDLLEGYTLHAGRRRSLAEDLPPAQRWLSPPLTSEWGVFLAGSDALHVLRAHGGPHPFERVVWCPPAGQSIRAAGAMHDGGVLVLATAPGGEASLTAVNGQDGAGTGLWTGTMDLAAEQGVWLGSLEDGSLWLVAGGTRWLIDPSTGRSETVALGLMRPTPAFWHRRLAEDLFEPEPIRAEGRRDGSAAVAVPGQDRGIVVVRLAGSTNAKPIARLASHGWVAADWGGASLLVGQEGAIACYGQAGMLWSLEVESASQARPVVAPDWLCVASVRNGPAADASGMATQIVFYLRSESDDTAPRQHVSAQIPGQPVRGLPPLLVGDTLVLATRVPGDRDLRLLVMSIANVSGRTGA